MRAGERATRGRRAKRRRAGPADPAMAEGIAARGGSGGRMTAIIRLAAEGDAEQAAAIYAPIVEGTATSFEVEPPDAGEMRRRIAATTAVYPWLVCERG